MQSREVAAFQYRGRDLHAYTGDLRSRLDQYTDYLYSQYPRTVPQDLWDDVLSVVHKQCGPSVAPALHNMNQHFKDGQLLNPELPGMNFAVMFVALWNLVLKHHAENSNIIAHFRETLEDIGSTCLAGVTDRLFADYIALHPLDDKFPAST